MESELIEPVLPRTPRPSVRSGHEKRKQKNHLPAAFFIYDKEERSIFGAVVARDVYRLCSAGSTCWWELARPVLLRSPFAINKNMIKFMSCVFALEFHVEAQVRLSESLPGGPLAGRFREFEHRQFRCSSFNSLDRAALFAQEASYIGYVQTPTS